MRRTITRTLQSFSAVLLRENGGVWWVGVTILGFGIGVDVAALKAWCDEVHAIHRLDTVDDSAAEAMFTL